MRGVQASVLITLALVMGTVGYPIICSNTPNWHVSGEDVMLNHRGSVTAIAFLKSSSPDSFQFASQYNVVIKNFLTSNLSNIAFIRVDLKDALSSMLDESLLPILDNITSYQDNEVDNISSKFEANENDVFIYDRCGRLTYYIPYPISVQTTSYIFAGILSTYVDNPCGPCSLLDNTDESYINQNGTAESKFISEFLAFGNETFNFDSNSTNSSVRYREESQYENENETTENSSTNDPKWKLVNGTNDLFASNEATTDQNITELVRLEDVPNRKENSSQVYLEEKDSKAFDSFNPTIEEHDESEGNVLQDHGNGTINSSDVNEKDTNDTETPVEQQFNGNLSFESFHNDSISSENSTSIESQSNEDDTVAIYNPNNTFGLFENSTEWNCTNKSSSATSRFREIFLQHDNYMEALDEALKSWFSFGGLTTNEDPASDSDNIYARCRPTEYFPDDNVQEKQKPTVKFGTKLESYLQEKRIRSEKFEFDELCQRLDLKDCSSHSWRRKKTLIKDCCGLRSSSNRVMTAYTVSK